MGKFLHKPIHRFFLTTILFGPLAVPIAGESIFDGTVQEFNLSDIDGSQGFVVNGFLPGDLSGISVSFAGDINADGVDDFIIGARGADPAGRNLAGECYVIFGNSNGFPSELEISDLNGSNGMIISGLTEDERLGTSVSYAGDFNGDNIDDIIVSALFADINGYNRVGKCYIIFGSSNGFSKYFNLAFLNGTNGFAINGINDGDRTGDDVSNAGDINSDGIDDVIITAISGDPNGKMNAGESFIVYGSSNGINSELDLNDLDGSNGFVINGIDAGDMIGSDVSGAGDINGDNISDIIIGAGAASVPGECYVIFGSTSGFSGAFELSDLDGTNGFKITGNSDSESLGTSVSDIGDINNDGINDLVIGDTNADPNGKLSAGACHVVFGSTNPFPSQFDLNNLDGMNGFTINGLDTPDTLGINSSGVGDVNGDNISDLLIAALRADPNDVDWAGQAYVIYGKSLEFDHPFELTNLTASEGVVINGIDFEDQIGRGVSSQGDYNGDGYSDVIIGAYKADPNGTDSGETYILFGSPPPDTTPPTPTISSIDSPTSLTLISGLTLDFDEDISIPTLTAGDFFTTGVSVTSINGGSQNFTLDLNVTGGDGVKELQLPAGAVDDLATTPNANIASNVVSFTFDDEEPEVPFNAFDFIYSPTSQTVFLDLPLIFSEPVTGLEVSDFDVPSTVTVTEVTGSGDTYSVDFTAPEEGIFVISLNSDAVRDLAGNPNDPEILGFTQIDITNPDFLIPLQPASSQMVPASSLPVVFEFRMNEGGTGGLVDGAIDLSSSTVPGVLNATVSTISTGSTPIFQISVDGATGPGDIVVQLIGSELRDFAGNPVLSSPSSSISFLDNSDVYDWLLID